MIAFILFVVVLLALGLSALCSALETGFVSVRRGRLVHLSREGSPKAKVALKAVTNIQVTLTTILIGNNIANVIYSSASAAFAVRVFSDVTLMQTIWSSLAAFMVLYLGEFIPKLLFSSRPLRRILVLVPFYQGMSTVLAPLTKIADWITRIFMPRTDSNPHVTLNEISRILKDRKDGVRLTELERELIEKILELRKAGQFITPEAIFEAVDSNRRNGDDDE